MGNILSTSDQILSAAQKLIVTGGYNGFSYADISEAVGIRKASIHHHFPSKADLVRFLVRQYRETAEAAMNELAHSIADPLEVLQAYSGYWTTCIGDRSNPFCICALLASELPVLPIEVASEVRAYFRMLSSWLASVMEEGMKSGKIKIAGSPTAEADAFMAIVHGAMLSARAFDDPAMFGTILKPAIGRLASGSSSQI